MSKAGMVFESENTAAAESAVHIILTHGFPPERE